MNLKQIIFLLALIFSLSGYTQDELVPVPTPDKTHGFGAPIQQVLEWKGGCAWYNQLPNGTKSTPEEIKEALIATFKKWASQDNNAYWQCRSFIKDSKASFAGNINVKILRVEPSSDPKICDGFLVDFKLVISCFGRDGIQ